MNKSVKTDNIIYIDTDSVFFSISNILENNGIGNDKWFSIDKEIRIKYIIKISKYIETVVNNRSYHETQLLDYNSCVHQDDFSIKLKQEIICANALFLKSKMYAFWVINEEGYDTDKIDAKGIEIVRSSSPTVFRVALKEILNLLLKDKSDDEMSNIVKKYKKEFYTASPEDISVNIGVNGINKYIINDEFKKGTPYHIKGVANYHKLLKEFGIDKKYNFIHEGDKCKVAYIKPNKYNIDVITFYKYPKEFLDNGIYIDYDIMIEKYFIKKANIILEPITKSYILEDTNIMDTFF